MTDLRRLGELLGSVGAASVAPGLTRVAAERETLRQQLGPVYDDAVRLVRESGLPFERALAAVQDPLMAAAIRGARTTGQPVEVVLAAIKAGVEAYGQPPRTLTFGEAMHRLRTDPGMPMEEVEELQRKMLARLIGNDQPDDGAGGAATSDPTGHFGDYIAQLVTTPPAPSAIGAVSADEMLREMRMVEEFEATVARDHKTIMVAPEDEARVRAAVRSAWADRWFDVAVMPGLPAGEAYVVPDAFAKWRTGEPNPVDEDD